MAAESTQCGFKKSALNMAQTDYTTSCTNGETQIAAKVAEYAKTRDDLQEKFDAATTIADSYLATLRTIKDARAPFDAYAEDLAAQKKALEDENIELQQKIRAGRRRFMDDGPQEGVSSILGLQTTDDKVLLAFWICFGVGMFGTLVLALRMLPFLATLSSQQKIAVLLGGLAASYVVAYAAIARFA